MSKAAKDQAAAPKLPASHARRTKPRQARKPDAQKGKKKSRAEDADKQEFPYPAIFRLGGKTVARMQMRSKKDLRRLNEFIELPGHSKWLRYNMREIMRATLHEDSEKGHLSHKAWLYGELFIQLWSWLRKLAASAENPNVRRDAGRVLGKVIHEIGTTQGALWIEELSKTNEVFQDSLVPFPSRKGGKPPKEDLVRWVRGQMIRLEWHWSEAMEVAWQVKNGRYSTLKEGWSALSERLSEKGY